MEFILLHRHYSSTSSTCNTSINSTNFLVSDRSYNRAFVGWAKIIQANYRFKKSYVAHQINCQPKYNLWWWVKNYSSRSLYFEMPTLLMGSQQ
ncbi:hypothetical protein [Pleurocapsa sp. FMAR1]|uniref:hypothetical protein n=1 Tax=Pleurocapsa sp. FMAR1 TaxID=3040204 RepID=UPI0029C6F260|nr:hypothetical protein [Pleurocapsa sp. FMAR1]